MTLGFRTVPRSRDLAPISLRIDGISDRGEGVGRVEGRAVFVPDAIPGERVTVSREKTGRRPTARLLAVEEPSPDRVVPDCPSFGRCGGCQLRHVRYPAQPALKSRILRDALRTIAQIELESCDVIPAPTDIGYRNHVRLRLEGAPGRTVRCGFIGRDGRELVPVDRCRLMPEPLQRALTELVRLLGLGRSGSGEVWLRWSRASGQILATLVGLAGVRGLPSLASVPGMRGVLAKPSNRERPPARPLWGEDHLVDELLSVRFSLRAESFFQVHPAQAEALFARAVALAGPPSGTVVDGYCGAGVLTRLLARRGWRSVGIELQSATVAGARRDAAADGSTVEFVAGPVEEILPRRVEAGERPAVVVLDPPRAGCHERVLHALRQAGVPRLIMISCHPGTLARDIARLRARGYRLSRIEAFDMFPHTAHLECLALLELG